MFLHDTSKNWSSEDYIFAYARITQPISHLHLSTYDNIFQKQPRFSLNFQFNPLHNKFYEWTTQYCSILSPHSFYHSSDLKPLLHSTMLQPFFSWFFAIDTAMLQIYLNVA